VIAVMVALAVRRIDWHVVAHSISRASLPLVIAAGVITFGSTLLKGIAGGFSFVRLRR
jgi:hypothetical protein